MLNNLKNVVRVNENDVGKKQETYFQKTNDGKQVLRDVMRNYIPNNIIDAVKQGFSAPDASWFKGDSIDFVKRRLLDSKSPIYNMMDYTSTKSLINEHLEGKQNRRLLIWSLLNTDEWCRQFLN